MNKEIVIYNCFPQGWNAYRKDNRIKELEEFASMLGQDAVQVFSDEAGKGCQCNLNKAIAQCLKDDAYLLTYDLESLKPNEQDALALIENLQKRMLFVMFVDDASVLRTISPKLYGNKYE